MKTYVLLLPLLLLITDCYAKEIARKSGFKIHQRNSSPEILKINGIQLYNNATKHLLAFVNSTSQTAIVFDYFTTNIAAINGQTKQTILINSDGNQLVENDTQLVWPADSENFETFYNNLQTIPNPENTTDCNDLSTEVGEITKNFGLPSIDPLATLRGISGQLYKNRDIIKVFLSRYRFPLAISHGISRFVRIIGANGRLGLNAIGGGVSIIPSFFGAIKHIDFNDVANASNGFEAFVRVFHQLANHLNYAKTFHRVVNDGGHLFNVIRNFGDDDNNVDNFFKISSNLLNLRHGNIQIEDFIRNATNLRGNLRFNIDDIRSNIARLQDAINIQNSRFHNGPQLQNFRNIVQGLGNNSLNIDGVDISRIAHLLAEGDFTNAVQLLIKIIIRMNELFNPFVAIPKVIVHFVRKGLNNASVDLPSVLQNGNPLDLLQHDNEINDVYKNVLNSVQRYSNGSLHLNNIVSPTRLLSINQLNNQIGGLLSVSGNAGTNQIQQTTTTEHVEGSARSRLKHQKRRHPQQHSIKHGKIHKIKQ